MPGDRARNPRIAITRAQLDDPVVADLVALLSPIFAVGSIAADQVVDLNRWLRDHRDSTVPAVLYLASVLDQVLGRKRPGPEVQAVVFQAIATVLPLAVRREVAADRLLREAQREAVERAEREEAFRREREDNLRREPVGHFNFLVAGVHYEGRGAIVASCVREGLRLRLVPEPGNRYDRHAVAVVLADGRTIGYVPRAYRDADETPEQSRDVSGFLESAGFYVAVVSKLIPPNGRYRSPAPIVDIAFYSADQYEYVADLRPDRCLKPSSRTSRVPPAIAFETAAQPLDAAWVRSVMLAGLVAGGGVLLLLFVVLFVVLVTSIGGSRPEKPKARPKPLAVAPTTPTAAPKPAGPTLPAVVDRRVRRVLGSVEVRVVVEPGRHGDKTLSAIADVVAADETADVDQARVTIFDDRGPLDGWDGTSLIDPADRAALLGRFVVETVERSPRRTRVTKLAVP